ncbi:MAG: TIGR01244 family sulfur transferase [Pseudomonadota bacterium]
MQINRLSPTFAVSPQVNPADMQTLAEAGFTTVICNRPDDEVPSSHQAAAIAAAAEAAGLTFIVSPIKGGTLGEQAAEVAKETQATDAVVFAYCRSGTRSCMAWAQAMAGNLPVDDIIKAGMNAGYDLQPLRPMLTAIADGKP